MEMMIMRQETYYNDNSILVRSNIIVVAHKNCKSFNKCFTKTDGIIIDDAEDLGLVMSMYNLMEYVQIILTQRVVHGFILERKKSSNIRLNY